MIGLSYDGKRENGIIFNEAYPWGAIYHGAEHKPGLSFSYHSFECFPEKNILWLKTSTGERRKISAEEKTEILNLAESWVQPLGQEGNPTEAQKKAKELAEAARQLDIESRQLTHAVPYQEMISWQKQEAEARALKADPNASTPFLSKLATARNLGETVEELADKVITNADFYADNFADILGAYQKQVKDIEAKYAT